MKIAILTQPMKTNYGGILQAYALQKILKDMGHEAWTIDLTYKQSVLSDIRYTLACTIRKYLMRDKKIKYIFPQNPTLREKNIIEKNIRSFVEENIQRTETVKPDGVRGLVQKYEFDAYIVGSDQVCRPKYSPNIQTYFLKFLGQNEKCKRISFAASFGVDKWEFNGALTKECKKLIKKFDAISVREKSGVDLCEKRFEVDAVMLLDPTIILKNDEYEGLVEKCNTEKKDKTLAVYMLDKSDEKEEIVKKVSEVLNLKPDYLLPEKKYSKKIRQQLDDCVFGSVGDWLAGIMGAEFVVTDSFHGAVFSIIHEKPFWVIGNKARGMTRFSSLLQTFGIEDRMILSVDDLKEKFGGEEMCCEKFKSIRSHYRKKAIAFLANALET
jgi:polysaccharide pyruvyl transferase WcaK-like protein